MTRSTGRAANALGTGLDLPRPAGGRPLVPDATMLPGIAHTRAMGGSRGGESLTPATVTRIAVIPAPYLIVTSAAARVKRGRSIIL